MNKLQILKEQILSLPAKKSRMNLIGDLQIYNNQMSAAFNTLEQTRQNAEQIVAVFSDMNLQIITEKVNSTAKTAQTLRKSLENKIENVQKPQSDDKFQLLTHTSKTAQNLLRDKWTAMLKGKIETYDKLVRASSSAKLRGSSSLVETLDRLRGQVEKLPETASAVQKVKDDLDGINTSFQELGLEGKISEFLIDAAAGRADAKALLETEVREFIEQNQLWSALSVKLG